MRDIVLKLMCDIHRKGVFSAASLASHKSFCSAWGFEVDVPAWNSNLCNLNPIQDIMSNLGDFSSNATGDILMWQYLKVCSAQICFVFGLVIG